MWFWLIHLLVLLVFFYAIAAIRRRSAKLTFEGKHVLITGGSSGIGEFMAYVFSALGATLTIASNEPKEVQIPTKPRSWRK